MSALKYKVIHVSEAVVFKRENMLENICLFTHENTDKIGLLAK